MFLFIDFSKNSHFLCIKCSFLNHHFLGNVYDTCLYCKLNNKHILPQITQNGHCLQTMRISGKNPLILIFSTLLKHMIVSGTKRVFSIATDSSSSNGLNRKQIKMSREHKGLIYSLLFLLSTFFRSFCFCHSVICVDSMI